MRVSRATAAAVAASASLVAVLLGCTGTAPVPGPGAGPRTSAGPAPGDACAGDAHAATLGSVDGPTHAAAPGPRAAVGDGVLLDEPFAGLRLDEPWADGSRHGVWQSVYDGYGTTRLHGGETVVLSQCPEASTSDEETHGALAVTVREYGDVDLTVRQRTVHQLRTPEPNTWEVPWVLWARSDDEHFYYLVLKPNGWELGKEDPAYPGAQRFLATGSSPAFPVGDWHTARVRHSGDTIEVWGDGRFLTRFVDRERPYRGGHVGLYTEDAHVEHADLVVRRGG